jgi:hypothetical protein
LQRQVQASQRQPSQRRPSKPSDFSEEYAGKRVVVTMHNGLVMEGLLLEARKYWFKLKDSSDKVVYVNKGFVATIEVFEEKRR